MKIYTKDEIFQVGYRTYDEAEILAFTDQCLKKKWIVKEINEVQKINQRFEISNYGKTKENQDSFISNYKCEKEYLKEIYEELEDIKKRVTLLGFRF